MYTWHDSAYNKRLKLTIDGSKISEDISNFPIMIHLSDSSGITKVDTTCVFDELLENYYIISDTFSGTSLDTSKWNTNIVPNASVTVSGALELNNFTGNAHSGAQCDSKVNIPKKGKIIFSCKWKPHKNHYSSAPIPAVIFYNYTTTTRNSYYGYINDNCLYLGLGADSDTINRTQLRLYSVSSQTWTTLDTVSIDIDENEWHDIYWEIDCDTKELLVKLDDIYELTGTVNDTDWQALGSYMKLELSTDDYNKNNTERFKDVYVEIPKNNSKKIALYTAVSGSDTQCYVEVDYWPTSSGFKNGTLWAKIPTISSGTDLDLYLYYDKNASNNSYIGHVGEYAAQQVWDSGFLAVYHLNSNNVIKDSTNNSKDGTAHNFEFDDIRSSITSKAVEFDGSNNYITIPEDMIDNQSQLTIEAACSIDVLNSQQTIISDGAHWWDDVSLRFGLNNSNKIFGEVVQNTSIHTSVQTVNQVQNKVNYVFGYNFYASNYLKIYINGEVSASGSTSVNYIKNEDNLLCIGRRNYGGGDQYFDGIIDELRISNTSRSDAWLYSSSCSLKDNLITYSTEEIKPSFIFSGYVKVNNVPVARTVYLYRRLTGEFVGSTVSNSSTGYFEIPTPYDDYHFVVILPKLDESYNIIAKDKIKYGD